VIFDPRLDGRDRLRVLMPVRTDRYGAAQVRT